MLTAGAGAVATLVAVAGLVPQAAKLRRTRDAAGLNLAWPALGVVSEGGWSAYALHEQRWLLAPSAVALVAFNLALVRLIARTGTAVGVPAVVTATWAGALVVVTSLGGWAALGVVLGVSYAVQVAPLLWSAYRTATPTGIAPATWVAALTEFGLWWVYGLATSDAGVVVLAAVGTAASLAVLGRWWATM